MPPAVPPLRSCPPTSAARPLGRSPSPRKREQSVADPPKVTDYDPDDGLPCVPESPGAAAPGGGGRGGGAGEAVGSLALLHLGLVEVAATVDELLSGLLLELPE